MKGKSIHKKVLQAILSISLAFGVVVSLAAVSQFYMQRRSIHKANSAYAENLSREAREQLTRLNRQVAENLTAVYGNIVDGNFKAMRELAESLAGYTGELYADMAGSGSPAGGGNPVMNGNPATAETPPDDRVGYMPGASRELLAGELSRVSGVREYIKTLAQYSPDNLDVLDIYVVTDSGMCLDGTGKSYEGEYAELRDSEWYVNAKETKAPYWAKAFVGAATGIRKITCGVPFYDKDGVFRGVAAVDLAVEHLYDTALSTRSDQVEHALLLDGNGEVMVNPDNYSLDGTDIAEGVHIRDDGFLSFVKIPETDWTLCMVFRFDMVQKTTESIGGIIEENSRTVGKLMNAAISRSILFFVLILAAGCLLVVFVSRKLTKGLVDPINRLTKEVAVIGSGDLDHKIEGLHTGDEIGQLADAFNRMTGELNSYIANLAAVTAEKERIGAELTVATQIQASMLPCIFPAFPERKEIDIYATMQPAKEVGGDFYDFFLVDESHLAVVIADVSGKGVPAALFMVIAKTLIKNHAQAGECPADVFTGTNRQLCESNDAGLFVTAWMGILDMETGEFTYVNAGHNPPLIRRKGGEFEYLKSRAGFVLAGMEGMKYRQASMTLEPGDMVYLYTDGVTEATDTGNQLYGEERLLNHLNAEKGKPLEEILQGIKSDIDVFVKGAPQFDDITMLVLRLRERLEKEEWT